MSGWIIALKKSPMPRQSRWLLPDLVRRAYRGRNSKRSPVFLPMSSTRLLRALVSAGQVRMLKVNGQLVFCAAV